MGCWMVEFDGEDRQAIDSQTESANNCIFIKKDVEFIIKDPFSEKEFQSVCKYVDNTNVIFVNQETKKERKAYFIN